MKAIIQGQILNKEVSKFEKAGEETKISNYIYVYQEGETEMAKVKIKDEKEFEAYKKGQEFVGECNLSLYNGKVFFTSNKALKTK